MIVTPSGETKRTSLAFAAPIFCFVDDGIATASYLAFCDRLIFEMDAGVCLLPSHMRFPITAIICLEFTFLPFVASEMRRLVSKVLRCPVVFATILEIVSRDSVFPRLAARSF